MVAYLVLFQGVLDGVGRLAFAFEVVGVVVLFNKLVNKTVGKQGSLGGNVQCPATADSLRHCVSASPSLLHSKTHYRADLVCQAEQRRTHQAGGAV